MSFETVSKILNSSPLWTWVSTKKGDHLRLIRVKEIRAYVEKASCFPRYTDTEKTARFTYVKIQSLRRQYRARELSETVVKACEAIPGWLWSTETKAQMENIAAIDKFVSINCRTPSSAGRTQKERALGQRLTNLRGRIRHGKISEKWKTIKEELDKYDWWKKSGYLNAFDIMIQSITDFAIKHKRMPRTSLGLKKENKQEHKLGKQLSRFRYAKRKGNAKKLTPARRKRLEAIPYFSWEAENPTQFKKGLVVWNDGKGKTATHRGVTRTTTQWAKKLGWSFVTMNRRLRTMPIAVALEPKPKITTQTVVKFKGKERTLLEWSKHLKIDIGTIASRFRHDLPIREVLAPVTIRTYRFRGEDKTLPAWAKVLGMKDATIRMRLKKGWSIRKAFTTSPWKTYEFRGEHKTLKEWALVTGVSRRNLHSRLSRGMTLEEAVTTPFRVQGKSRR